ncbi:MAG: hypothetical protein Q8Q28_00195 [Pseudomonadota bacterium]|nr:hypothetical protein [Pseudomonadota bacterium]
MNYPALIAEHANHLPPADQKEALGFILFLEQRAGKVSPDIDEEERGRRLAEALRKLQEAKPFAEITDPVAWQREIRQDRPLPGRED